MYDWIAFARPVAVAKSCGSMANPAVCFVMAMTGPM
jgi:hypothetical protein